MASKNQVNAVAKRKSRPPSGGSRSRAKLGQNFLRDPQAARQIVDALGDVRCSTVIEIGPGKGVLTELLAARAKRLIGIELDRSLAAQMRMQYARRANVEIIEGDVLQVDLANLIRRQPGPLLAQSPNAGEELTARAHVIGNLPYYITSDILLHLFRFHEWLETLVIMVQREVADRIAATPGNRDYGLLSATCQLFAKTEKLFTLPPGAFAPPPKVHSTVLRLRIAPRWEELQIDAEGFVEFLKLAFAQKRKTLANNLRGLHPQPKISDSLTAAKIRPDVRAEALPLEKMAALFRSLQLTVHEPQGRR
jgi:16S rRNA (adenine1518-N6/adenine1519-N6)-dimethyltransferase